jgi:hypothetical protein
MLAFAQHETHRGIDAALLGIPTLGVALAAWFYGDRLD